MSYLAVGGLLAIPALYYYLGYVKYKPRDWFFAFSIARAKMALARMIKHNELIDVSWKNILAKFPGPRPAMHFGESVYTLAQIEELSNRVANFLLSRGLKKGDCIALYMHNCPEYIAIWLGASKIGVVTALVNFNLKHIALVHSLKEASAKLVIFGGDLADNVHEVSDDLQQHPDDDTFSLKNTELFVHNGSSDIAKSLNAALENAAPTPVPADATAVARGVKVSDPLLYIYTSGTTGMPKAAVITHHRYYAMANAFTLLCSITSEDRIYIALPVYHSAAGIVGVGQMFFAGSTLIINAHNKGKFSASNFWPDVRRYGATVIQYIGEVCRYLVAQPADPKDGVHNVRVAIGNGLRPDVWKQFQTRFNIKHIAEFYGATEGAAGLMNTDNRFGAVGFLSPLVSRIAPMKLIKIDRETGEPIRDPKGFCIEADIDEPGEYIAKILVESGVKNFMGYRSAEATKKKVLGDAFTKGDSWFRSGDLLRKDKDGFVFFVDRIGDTFRWKGENVSTNEVAEILSSFSTATQEPNVYGVSVPGQDGRAGMVAFSSAFVDSESKVVRAGEIDWPGFAAHVVRELPTYARPLFVRILPNVMETTGTFKHKKSHLVDQGFDPRTVKDPLYFLKDNQYVSLTPEIYDQIVSGAIRI